MNNNPNFACIDGKLIVADTESMKLKTFPKVTDADLQEKVFGKLIHGQGNDLDQFIQPIKTDSFDNGSELSKGFQRELTSQLHESKALETT